MSIPQALRIKPPQYLQLSKGRHYIEELLGEGGFGSVYRSNCNNQVFALKLNRFWELHPDERDHLRKRFRQEFEISESIPSQYLVRSFGYEEILGNPLIIYDYCDGGSLKNKINGNFLPNFYRDIALQILKGLRDLHRNNIIHRDLKPENILFKQGKVVLTDFGISANLKKRLTQVNKRGYVEQIFASVCYSAPEQADKTRAYKFTGPNNDIFSFGVLMFEWFTHGKMPFGSVTEFQQNPNQYESRKKNGNWNIKLIENSVNEKIWLTIIDKCLQPLPRDRYQNVDEIIQVLEPVKSEPLEVDNHRHSLKGKPNFGDPANTGNWKLKIIEGPGTGQEFNLSNLAKFKNKRLLRLGRLDPSMPLENDIFLQESGSAFISRYHATLEQITRDEMEIWVIRDGQWYQKEGLLGWHLSRNGFTINGQKAEGAVVLKGDDVLQVGKIKLQISCAS